MVVLRGQWIIATAITIKRQRFRILFSFSSNHLFDQKLVGLMHEPIENRIGQRGILQPRMPVFKRQLAGDHSRARTDMIIK
jgi:hypothetical protein